MAPYRFKIGMRLMDLGLDSFDEMLAVARDIGVESVWFNRLPEISRVARLSDAEWDEVAGKVSRSGLAISVISPEIPFKKLHLTELELEVVVPGHVRLALEGLVGRLPGGGVVPCHPPRGPATKGVLALVWR